MPVENFVHLVNTDPFLLFFGTFYFVLGASFIFAQPQWREIFELFIEHNVLSVFMGILVLPISLFIVVFYNNWDSIGSIILMVIGYIGLIKALLLLLRPSLFQGLLKKDFVRKWMWLDGLSGILLGGAMLVL